MLYKLNWLTDKALRDVVGSQKNSFLRVFTQLLALHSLQSKAALSKHCTLKTETQGGFRAPGLSAPSFTNQWATDVCCFWVCPLNDTEPELSTEATCAGWWRMWWWGASAASETYHCFWDVHKESQTGEFCHNHQTCMLKKNVLAVFVHIQWNSVSSKTTRDPIDFHF